MNNLATSHANPAAATAVEWLTAGDGHRIPLRHWPVANPVAVVHLVHGMAEHSGCYADVAAALNAAGYAAVAHDHRCHGLAVAQGTLGNVGLQQHWRGVCHDMAVVNAVCCQKLQLQFPADAPEGLVLLGQACMSYDHTERPSFRDVLDILEPLNELLVGSGTLDSSCKQEQQEQQQQQQQQQDEKETDLLGFETL